MMDAPFESKDVLLCFAVKEEAVHARKLAPHVLCTGMGAARARQAVEAALCRLHPRVVVSSGFAGALNPALRSGQVVFQPGGFPLADQILRQWGARPVKFHEASRVVVTKQEKSRLWESSGADAVEMESRTIEAVCREHGVPCLMVRVISDEANEDLPLDFNRFMDANQNLCMLPLILSLLGRPGRWPSLLRLRRTTRRGAQQLAEALSRLIR